MGYEIKIFAGNGSAAVAGEICTRLGLPLGKMELVRHADGELGVHIHENVRGADVFVVQSTSPPVNDHVMELLLVVDAVKRASARRITAVVPYYGYARQDRKTAPRVPISAKLVADLLQVAGIDRLLTVDLHAGQIQGFFDLPVDHLMASAVLVDNMRRTLLPPLPSSDRLVVVAPDSGSVERARDVAARLNAPLAIIDKRSAPLTSGSTSTSTSTASGSTSTASGSTSTSTASGSGSTASGSTSTASDEQDQDPGTVIGDVRGKEAIIVDDILDTGRTIQRSVAALKRAGAVRFVGCVTHALLSEGALDVINACEIEKVFVSNTVNVPQSPQVAQKIVVCNVAKLLGEAIRRTHNEESFLPLFS
eukprot:TRINITY_DN4314_c0_g1_i2.p1 TRINITY_DN4314_c0_g1~~TRINITY_DN4314_c0_g1_i2.p1  ORF type:complete len:365 (-),score=85.14 TRINITY_DN4314_c0_g1_i2:240-1334(-)